MSWISVDDRLPDDLQVVLCAFNRVEVDTAIYSERRFMDTCCACKRYLVTHWQPLPEPPKDKAP
jgi:hypothetical protein